MKDIKYHIIEGLCVVALAVFVVTLCVSRSGGTDKSIGEISSPVIKLIDSGQMAKKTNADAVKTFKLDSDKAEGVVYYANDNVMDVSEMLIIKLRDKADSQEVRDKINHRVEEQKKLYKSYAPKQYALLQNSITEVSGNTVFYCAAKNAGKLYDKFKNSL